MRPPQIVDADLPAGILGYTDGTTTIWLDRYLTAVDRRVVIPPLDPRGRLPLGRHVTDLAELRERFATDAHRSDMFEELLSLLQVITLNIHPVSALWVGGSYVTSTPAPRDIDVVFLIPAPALVRAQHVGGAAAEVVKLLLEADPENHFPPIGVRLLADEGPFARAMSEASRTQKRWLAHRGYWDQLWQCARGKQPGEQIPYDHGYLEVMIDGYTS